MKDFPVIKIKAMAVLAMLTVFLCGRAQTPVERPDLSKPSMISPYYFGPNAFPVPEMSDGTTSRFLRVEVAGNYFLGFKRDHTFDVTLKAVIPLFTDRVNLSIWIPAMDWYHNTRARLEESRLGHLYDTDPEAVEGCCPGDAYVSTDIHVFKQKKYVPDVTVRAALKTASGDKYFYARYYDSPGYFFDATAAKSLRVGEHDFRAALSAGFLCWQTGNGRQNDAVMYGAMLRWSFRNFSITETFSGYSGWEHLACKDPGLAKDSPAIWKTHLSYKWKRWDFQVLYGLGTHDYPFHQFRIAVAYDIPVLGKNK